METVIKFAKLDERAIIPTKREEDAGFDLYAIVDEPYIVVLPHDTHIFDTGLCSAFSSDYYVQLQERGSTGIKGISNRAGVFDSGFRNEWKIPLTNLNEIPIVFYNGNLKPDEDEDSEIYDLIRYFGDIIYYPLSKAITQFIVLPVPKTSIVETTVEDIKSTPSERGEGKLGSSGK